MIRKRHSRAGRRATSVVALAAAGALAVGPAAAQSLVTPLLEETVGSSVLVSDRQYPWWTDFHDLLDDGDIDKFEDVVDDGSLLPCIPGGTSPLCGAAYQGLQVLDVDADGRWAPGFVMHRRVLDGAEGYPGVGPLLVQETTAALWDRTAGGIVILDVDQGVEAFAHYDLDAINIDSDLIDEVFTLPDVTDPDYEDHPGHYQFQASVANDIDAHGTLAVGTANYIFGEVLLAFERLSLWHPLVWSKGGAGWGKATVLEMRDVTVDPVVDPNDWHNGAFGAAGGANAISDDGDFIAGWDAVNNVRILFDGGVPDFERAHSTLEDVEAVLWRNNEGWSRLGLGRLDGGDNASEAHDVNSLGQVVGWSGTLDHDDTITRDAARPFIWLPDDPDASTGTMNALDLSTTDTTWTHGDALAISEGGEVAVGWVSDEGGDDIPWDWSGDWVYGLPALDPFPESRAAAWITGPGGDWTTHGLVVLDTPDAFTAGFLSSHANAVDAAGRVIVGSVYHTVGGETEQSATVWEFVDPARNEVLASSLDSSLAAGGVDTGGLRLTEATAVRTVFDADGELTDLILIGVGEGSFGSWLAVLARQPGGQTGVTTPSELVQSLSETGAGIHAMLSPAGRERCRWDIDDSDLAENPWCYFAVGSGVVDAGGGFTGGALAGHHGVAHYFTPDTSIGGSFGLEKVLGVSPHLAYDALRAELGLYGAHEPEEGLRLVGAVNLGKLLDAHFQRSYVNGAGTAVSTGTTGGHGYGLHAYAGYGFALTDDTRVVPFVELNYARTILDGWVESGGTFPMTIAATAADRLTGTIGIGAEHEFSDDETAFATLSWTQTWTGGAQVSGTTLVGGLPFTAPAVNQQFGSLQLTSGAQFRVDEKSAISGSANIATDLAGAWGAGASLGYQTRF